MTDLFTPLKLGDLWLPNRVVMAPLTRTRATGGAREPNALMATYYRQRASAGLILSEATIVAPRAAGYADTPGLYTAGQREGWCAVTRAVHAAGGRIFAQLWHVGRISHSSLLGGELPVAPSAVAAAGRVSLLRPETPYEVPHALAAEEIPGIVGAFRHAATEAMAAGFDGVELHAANGYLIDQFLQDSSNRRQDEYGGNRAGRARLLLECVDALAGVWGPQRVGVHLAPRGDAHDMGDGDPLGTFGHVMDELDVRGIAFVCVREHRGEGRIGPQLRRRFRGVYIANEGYDGAAAAQALDSGEADAVAFGKAFIANPDLPRRLAEGAPLNAPDFGTFYGTGAAGYTDYPALSEAGPP
ncbi:MAG: hypothetical protein RL026_1031 [Pseudomonadota bacterium]|jgi:2,4-dienoyl-CoA reductase-like NADH-dependent reductase (Old Yellow Enzyme family)